MADNKKTFHEWALESILFKGRQDWYFCFLKAEKIAHVLVLLSEKVKSEHKEWFLELVDDVSDLPHMMAHFAAGETGVESVLADVFSLISAVRLSGTRGFIAQDTAAYIAQEYEGVAQKLASGTKLSPFVSPQDFSVPDFLLRPNAPEALPPSSFTDLSAPRSAGRPSPHKPQPEAESQPQSDRRATILHFVLQNKAVSIKEICAVVPDCSEKTVQRELASLIAEGLIKREGERRWSVYKPA